MMNKLFLTLLSSFLLCVLAAPPTPKTLVQVRDSRATLPFVTRFNASGSKIPEVDRARAAGLREHALGIKSDSSKSTHGKRQSSFTVTNQVVSYVASVGVGSPPSSFNLIIDTGSSNTWVGADKQFQSTQTTEPTLEPMAVEYGSGFFVGQAFTDTVTLAPDLVITGQKIGVALLSEGFQGVDGILGVGPTDLTEGTLVTDPFGTIPTVTDNLFSQGTIEEEVLGVFFAPTTTEESANGEMTFGGIDDSKITQDVQFFPITATSTASEFWGIDQSITYGTEGTTILSSTAGIVDTGTTLLLIATDAFDAYTAATGAALDSTTGLLSISPENYANLQSLFFHVGDSTFEFTKNAQTWPRALNAAIGGTSSDILLVVGDIGTNSGQGLDFINGFTFLERFYSVFDTTNKRVGLATTAHTNDEVN
ncbi:acid protease [Pyrrhoderma noxium]|uniref:Acid protease n=1 Tax=Pyrrhoderma noxium TaxID=2282107 RepID=A0A286UTX3_9AGAM|nr:acid protease [Pyrrhoderma noxium]